MVRFLVEHSARRILLVAANGRVRATGFLVIGTSGCSELASP